MKHYLNSNIKIVSSKNEEAKLDKVNLVNEHVLNLYVNNKQVNKFICVNEHLEEIVVGWLLGNRYINCYGDVCSISFKNNNSEAYVTIKEVKVLEPLGYKNFNYEDTWIFDLVNKFLRGTKIHKHTSGTHCCMLSINGKIVLTREDIGRHNAVDKVIGYIYINNIDVKDCVIFSSGRVSSDLIEKVINAKIPVFVSKSVTSYQAVKLAQGYIRLICKAWPDSFEVYS